MSASKYLLKFLFILLIPLGILLSYISSRFPVFIERKYSMGIYRPIGQILSSITGIIPISIGEFIIIGVVLFSLWRIIHLISNIIKHPDRRRHLLLNFSANIIMAVCLVYFCFLLIWGFNYYRSPFSTISGLDVRPSSVKELQELCSDLLSRANSLRTQVHENNTGVMKLSSGRQYILNVASKGYINAAAVYPELGGKYGRPKGVLPLMSTVMSYAGISGVYFPYTGEANVNTLITDSEFPFTACHEMAHQHGFSREDEANYIAYFVCTKHPDVDFQYSGVLMALIESSNALYSQDKNAFKTLRGQYSEGVLRDLRAINSFWQQYEGPINDVSTKINDAYLKANNQNEGVKSYGRMVDLLLAEYRANKSGRK